MIVSKLKLIKFLDLTKTFNLIGFLLTKPFYFSRTRFLPISVDIETILNCNMRCVFCQNPELMKVRDKKRMSLQEFESVLNQFPTAIRVNVQGIGEPLLNPDIVNMIRCAKSQNKFVTMTTNAMLLNSDKAKANAILESGLDRLIISLDSPFKEQYEAVRHGAVFETVVDNIEQFVKLRQNAKSPEVVIWMLGLESTLSGLPEMIRLAKRLNVDQLVLQHRINGWGKLTWMEKARKLRTKTVTDVIAKARQEARTVGLKFTVNTKFTSFKDNAEDTCAWPWGAAFIASNGSVVPCCMVADPNIATMGNVFEQEFKDIWNQEPYVELRKNLKCGSIPEFCQHCYQRSEND